MGLLAKIAGLRGCSLSPALARSHVRGLSAGAAAAQESQSSDSGVSVRRGRDRDTPVSNVNRPRDLGLLSPFGSLFDIWTPMSTSRSLKQMMETMDRVLSNPTAWGGLDQSGRGLRAPWDIVEKDDAYYLRIDMPGISKEELKMYVEDEELVIRGEHAREEEKGEEFESNRASYSTRVLLPKDAKLDEIKAELKNGVLKVKVPKQEQKKKTVDVQVA